MKLVRTPKNLYRVPTFLSLLVQISRHANTSSSVRAFSYCAARVPDASCINSAASASVSPYTTRCTVFKMSSATTTIETPPSAINPLLQMDDLPKFTSIQASDITPAVTDLLEKLQVDLDLLEEKLMTENGNDNTSDATTSTTTVYDTVVPIVERMQFPISYVWGVAGHLNGVKNSPDLREAYEANQPAIVQAMSKFSQSKPIYDALLRAQLELQNHNESNISAKRRAVENSLRAMKLGGVGLDGVEKERFNESKLIWRRLVFNGIRGMGNIYFIFLPWKLLFQSLSLTLSCTWYFLFLLLLSSIAIYSQNEIGFLVNNIYEQCTGRNQVVWLDRYGCH